MCHNDIDDIKDFSNLSLLYQDESEDNKTLSNEIFNNSLLNKPSDSSDSVIKEKIYFYPQKPKKEKIFHIEKIENKINKAKQNLSLKHIEINKVIPSLNQKFDIITDETKEISNINCGEKNSGNNKFIGKKRVNILTDENNRIGKEREDNCRYKIGRNFFNAFLIFEIINPLIKQNGSKLYFEKFPQKFVRKATNKKNDRYLGKNLEDLLTKEELYEEEEKKKGGNFMHNCNALAQLKNNDDNNNILEKSGLNEYLGKKYFELYKEYLKSETHEKKIIEEKGQKLEEFKKFSEFEKFIGFYKN